MKAQITHSWNRKVVTLNYSTRRQLLHGRFGNCLWCGCVVGGGVCVCAFCLCLECFRHAFMLKTIAFELKDRTRGPLCLFVCHWS